MANCERCWLAPWRVAAPPLHSVDAFGNKSLLKFMLQSKPFNRRITECASNWKREELAMKGGPVSKEVWIQHSRKGHRNF